MITGTNESKTLTKQISCKCKCKVDGRKCNSDQWWNNNKCQCECKNVCEDDHILKPAKCSCINGKYLATVMDDSAITWGENINAKAKLYDEKTKNVAKKFNDKKKNVKYKISIFLFTFFPVSIIDGCLYLLYGYLIKYQAKQNHLLPFYDTNKELKESMY